MPNPATNFIYLQLNKFGGGSATIQLQDMQGNVLKQQQLNLRDADQTQIDVSSFANGIYLLIITNNDGKRFAQKIVVKR